MNQTTISWLLSQSINTDIYCILLNPFTAKSDQDDNKKFWTRLVCKGTDIQYKISLMVQEDLDVDFGENFQSIWYKI